MELPDIPVEISDHYEHDYDEAGRITTGLGELELMRTREIIERYLPAGPLRVLDVGGGPGAHARWLAQAGHHVELIDPMPRHVEAGHALAAEGLPVTAQIGDARALADADNSVDVVLLLGPLYHLTELEDRRRTWSEALRVAKPGGLIFAAGVSRFASLFSGLSLNLLADPAFSAMAKRDLREGQHRNPDRASGWFTTAYFHHPDEIVTEAAEAGAEVVELFGVEGLAGWLPQLADNWNDPTWRATIIGSARAVETEPTLRGLSAHLLLVTRKPA